MPSPAEGFAARFVVGPALRTQPDGRLVSLVREGYENAFEEIVRRYGKPLTRYAGAIVGGRAEDVTQDAFSKALLALRRDGAEIELRPWLFRIVRNTALNDLRDSPPSAEALADVIASGASPAEKLERREDLADLMRRLQSLPEAQRAAIVMRELEGLSHEEIAGALGLSDGGARQAIYRARRSLRDGAGMLLPLPLLKALLSGAAGAPVDAAAGTGVVLKAAVATILVAGTVGTGVAIDHNRQAGHPQQAEASRDVAEEPATLLGTMLGDNGRGDGGSSTGHSELQPGSDHGRHDGSRRSGGSGPGRGEDRSSAIDGDEGPGDRGGDHSGSGDDHSGAPGPSGHDGSGGDSGDESSGRGSGGSSGSGDDQSSTSGSSSGSDGGSGDISISNSGPGSSLTGGDDLNSGSGGSMSSGGPGPSDGDDSASAESSDGQSTSGDSRDSHGGDGFSVQTEPQTEEEP
jgi:RNA polymerase sigma factor (sigma-70 family)